MSDILDDLKMMADHCDQENGNEPCDLGMLLIRAIAEIRKLRQQPVGEVPMPDTCGELSDRRKIFDETAVRIYGQQCYAAGVADAAEYREILRLTRLYMSVPTAWSPRTVNEFADRIDAAMRGEVK